MSENVENIGYFMKLRLPLLLPESVCTSKLSQQQLSTRFIDFPHISQKALLRKKKIILLRDVLTYSTYR